MKKKIFKTFISLFLVACMLAACGESASDSNTDILNEGSEQTDSTEAEQSESSEEQLNSDSVQEENSEKSDVSGEGADTVGTEEDELPDPVKGETEFDSENATSYMDNYNCLFDMESQELIFSGQMREVPSSDDENLYIFAVATYEDTEILYGDPVASCTKAHSVSVNIKYSRPYLFARFVPALMENGEYVPIACGKYMSNPEILAPNKEEYPEISSKKGLLIDPKTLGTEKLTDLNISQAIYNIPLSMIIGESTNPDIPTIEFEYAGQTYYFNGANVIAYDSLFKYLESEGIYSTAIILNDWNTQNPEIIHPLSRSKTSKSLYYAFNTEEEEGVRLLEATALFLAERYSDGWHGRVYSWVIANEINQQKSWNYMDTTDLDYYVDSFERGFRIFYNAIKSRYASAKVYYSIDHSWNDNKGRNSKWFNGRELVETFNSKALEHGNYDWRIAIHPYPNPLTRVNYWSQSYDMTREASILTLMNISSITEILEQDDFRDTSGNIRTLSVTELGFTSYAGEKLQAAAFAYCYYILEANPYIDSFMMNRETDAWEEMQTGLAFGVYNSDLSEKYIADVFKNIDTDDSGEYREFMLNIIGAESLEEALSWASPQPED